MQKLVWTVIFAVLALQPISIAGIDIDKVLLEHRQKIKHLMRKNQDLVGEIEKLQQQQTITNEKIKELFNLIEYKKSSVALEQQTLKTSIEDKQAKKTYTRARDLLSNAKYLQAITAFKRYLTHYPNNKHTADAQYWLAKSYLAQEDYHNAKQSFVLFQKKNPNHSKFANVLYDMAVTYQQLNEIKMAEQKLQSMIKNFPNHLNIVSAKALLNNIQAAQSKAKPKQKTIKTLKQAEPIKSVKNR